MCFLSGGCMLIAEVVVMVVVGAQSAAHPALQTCHCEKKRAAGHTGFDIKGNQDPAPSTQRQLVFLFFVPFLGSG